MIQTPITAQAIAQAERPATKMLLALSATGKHVYEGTVDPAVVAHRRAKNRAARRARAMHRRRSERGESTSSSGIGLGGVLFVVFLVLKLTGVITWSWWWVTAPLWIPALLVLVIGLPVLLLMARRT